MNLFTRCAPGLIALTIAAGASVAVATFASAQGAPPASSGAPGTAPMPPHPPMDRDGPGRHGGRMKMELDRLKGSLKLNASQTALWDRAEALMKPSGDPRDAMRTRRDRMAAMLDDPNFDPRKLAADMDAAQGERRARMASLREAWFAVYDSLNPVQRGQAREFLRSHMAPPRWMHDGHGIHDGHGERTGDGHRPDGDGKGPMPPR